MLFVPDDSTCQRPWYLELIQSAGDSNHEPSLFFLFQDSDRDRTIDATDLLNLGFFFAGCGMRPCYPQQCDARAELGCPRLPDGAPSVYANAST
jgi:hypothetical protein